MRLLSAVATAALFVGVQAAESPSPPPIDEARSAVGKWVATQELIFKEKKAWQQESEVLASRIELVGKEIGDLEQKLAESEKVRDEQDSLQGEVAASRNANVELGRSLTARVTAFEGDVRRLRAVLPEHVREKVEPLYRRIPANPEATNVAVAERFQNVVGILNEINKVSGEITVANEIRPLSDGKPSEVKTVYVGLAQAYFISARGEAGVGRPTAEGWVWEPAGELSKDIGVMIQILQNKVKPQFISLPVTIE